MKSVFIFFLASLLSVYAIAQVTIHGTITDKKSGNPIVGALVIAKGNPAINAITGPGGKYVFNVPAGVTEIEALAKGYTSKSQSIADKTSINFALATSKGKGKKTEKTKPPKGNPKPKN